MLRQQQGKIWTNRCDFLDFYRLRRTLNKPSWGLVVVSTLDIPNMNFAGPENDQVQISDRDICDIYDRDKMFED